MSRLDCRAAHRFSRLPCNLSQRGLSINGIVQAFWCERRIQESCARTVASPGDRVLNVGLGLGFSHNAFVNIGCSVVDTIELNKSVIIRVQKRINLSSNARIIHSDWREFLSAKNIGNYDSIYIDAFPIGATFDYSQKMFFDEFLSARNAIQLYNNHPPSYFLSFERPPLGGCLFRKYGFKLAKSGSLPQAVQMGKVFSYALYKCEGAKL